MDIDQKIEIYNRVKEIRENALEIVEQEKPIDKLNKIIAGTSHSKVTDLQKHMQMRIYVVNDLIEQLVKEEWLVKDGRNYKLIASEEKWRSH